MARRHLLLAVLLALLPYAWLTHRLDWLCDDAFISFRYAQHLAAGDGLRFNIGEQPPVEGYSNFLWVLALTPFEAAGWPSPAPSRLLSVACGALLLVRLAGHLAGRLRLPATAVVVALAFYATLPPVAIWSTSGLETMAFALLLFLAYEFLGRPGRIAAAAAACAGLILIRAEGFAWAGLLIALAGAGAWLGKDHSARRPLVLAALAAAATAAGLAGFRLWYFGYPLPNTVYAKMDGSPLALERGARYAASFLLTFPHLAVILLAGVAAIVVGRASRRRLWRPLTIAAAFFGFAVTAGGDFMPMGRLLIPALPFLAIVLAGLTARFVAGRRWAFPLAGALAATLGVFSLLPAFDRHPVPEDLRARLDFRWNMKTFDSELMTWRRMRNRVAIGRDLARVLREHTLPGESLPYGRIGALAYDTRLFILDQNGLTHLEVARRRAPPPHPRKQRKSAGHDKHVPRHYFLKDRPTYYRARIERELPEEGRARTVRKLLGLDHPPEVGAAYAPLVFEVDSQYGKYLLLAKRKDLLATDSEPIGRRWRPASHCVTRWPPAIFPGRGS